MTADVALWLVKAVHVAAIALWAGGLLALPFVLAQRRGLRAEPLHRLHALTRFFYTALISPAAFVAIASGIVLVFLRATYVEWSSAKLAFVGLLVVLHAAIGLAIVKVFTHERRFGTTAATLFTTAELAAILPILWLVLAKPEFDATTLRPDLFAPGGLARLLEPLTAWATP
ncbi:MAG: CopD family protein [Pseudomonadota bacterium]